MQEGARPRAAWVIIGAAGVVAASFFLRSGSGEPPARGSLDQDRTTVDSQLQELSETRRFEEDLRRGRVDFDSRDPSRGIEPPTALEPD